MKVRSSGLRHQPEGLPCIEQAALAPRVSAKITTMNKDISNFQRWLITCQQFEQKYGMTSDEFLLKLESGELDDSQDYFDWFAAKRALELQPADQEE